MTSPVLLDVTTWVKINKQIKINKNVSKDRSAFFLVKEL
jgi:hypothetical protein